MKRLTECLKGFWKLLYGFTDEELSWWLFTATPMDWRWVVVNEINLARREK